MKIGPVAQFVLIGCAVGIIAPFFLSLCLFGSTLPVFLTAEPTPGFWSGAPTPVATAVPNLVQLATSNALHRGGAASFVIVAMFGALAGEAAGGRLPGHPWHKTRREVLGAILGGVIFSFVAMLLFLP